VTGLSVTFHLAKVLNVTGRDNGYSLGVNIQIEEYKREGITATCIAFRPETRLIH
jgi:hypothetical protein